MGDQTVSAETAKEPDVHVLVAQLRGALGALWPQCRPYVLLVLAFSLYRTWEEIFFIGPDMGLPSFEVSRNLVLFFTKGSVLLLGAVFSGFMTRAARSPLIYAVLTALMLASSVCALASKIAIGMGGPLYYAAAFAGGMGVGLTMLLWFSQCGRAHPLVVVGCVLAGRIIGPVFMIACHVLPLPVLAAVGCMLPVIVGLTLHWGLATLPSIGDLGQDCWSCHPQAPWNAAALMAVFGFAFAMRETLIGNSLFGSGSYTALGSLIVCVLLVPVVTVPAAHRLLVPMFRIGMPLTIVAFLMLPSVPAMLPLSDACSAAASTFAEVFAVMSVAAFCWRRAIVSFRAAGIVFGAHYMAVGLGRCALTAFNASGMANASEILFTLTASLAIVLTILLLPGKRVFKEWGLADAEGEKNLVEQEGADLTKAERFAFDARAFAKNHGLTSREEEVLIGLLSGKVNAQIEKELLLGRETVRTHRRNLYGKCDAHSVEELRARFEEERRG